MPLVYFSTFLLVAAGVLLTKTLKYHGNHVFRFPTLHDLVHAGWMSCLMAWAVEQGAGWSALAVVAGSAMFGVVLIDALTFRAYTFEVEPASVRMFFANLDDFMSESSDLWSVLRADGAWLLPLLMTGGFLSVGGFLPEEAIRSWLALFVGFLLYSGSKLRPSAITWLSLAAVIAFVAVMSGQVPRPAIAMPLYWGIVLPAGLTALRAALKRWIDAPFVRLPSIWAGLLGLGRPQWKPVTDLTDEETRIVEISAAIPARSQWHGSLAGANIVLITIESAGRRYVDLHSSDGARLAPAAWMAANSLSGVRHHCGSPNTNNTFGLLYNADYPSRARWPFVAELKRRGYSTAFLTTQRLNAFGLGDLLNQAGIDFCVGAERLLSERSLGYSDISWGIPDRHLRDDALDLFLAGRKAEAPFFLHLLNSQTHATYRLGDPLRYNRFNNATRRGRYLNTLEEAGDLFDDILGRLRDIGLLGNTIVILTGDHGQAFGEFGYTVHSNAVIEPELDVPFLLWHPALPARTVDYSSHLDVFPTIFDLLGIETGEPVAGRNLFVSAEPSPTVVYSQTRRGGMPSNFGFVEGDRKLMLDLIFHRHLWMSRNDEIERMLDGAEASHWMAVMAEALRRRGLAD